MIVKDDCAEMCLYRCRAEKPHHLSPSSANCRDLFPTSQVALSLCPEGALLRGLTGRRDFAVCLDLVSVSGYVMLGNAFTSVPEQMRNRLRTGRSVSGHSVFVYSRDHASLCARSGKPWFRASSREYVRTLTPARGTKETERFGFH